MPWERRYCEGCGAVLNASAIEFCRNCGGLLAPLDELGVSPGGENWRDDDETDPAERGEDHLTEGESEEDGQDAAAAWLVAHDKPQSAGE